MIFTVVVMPARATASQTHHGVIYFVGAGVGIVAGAGAGGDAGSGVDAGGGVGIVAGVGAGSGAVYFIVPIICS